MKSAKYVVWVRAIGFVAVLAVIFVLGQILPGSQLYRFSLIGIYAIAMVGLDILTGRTGPLSLGHVAFYAIGAYTTAILMTKADWNYVVTLPAAGLVAGFFGLIIGIPCLRLAGVYLAIATFALAAAVSQLLKKMDWLTGGVQGINLAPRRPPVPFGLEISLDQWLYYFTMIVAVIMFILAWNLVRGRLGRAFLAVKQSDLAAAASGVNLAWYKTLSFGIAAFYAGIAGGVFAILMAGVPSAVFPDTFDFFLSVEFLAGILIGGLGTLAGPVIGAFLVIWIPPIASQINQQLPWAIYGVILMFIVMAAPSGIMGLVNLGFVKARALVLRFWPSGSVASESIKS